MTRRRTALLATAVLLAAVGPLIDSLHARGYRVGPVQELMATLDRLEGGSRY